MQDGIEEIHMATETLSRVSTSAALSAELAALAERTRAGVVQVSDGRGGGAGTIWSSDGLIVTNYHVVPGERARVTLAGETELSARVVANLPERDLAVLQVDATGLSALPVGDSTALRPGELVMAVGHPLGVPGSVSLGIFSGVGPIEGRSGRHLREALLANIELRPGNSGGPLVNARGEVVGINAMVIGPGTALAVPSATVRRVLEAGSRRTIGIQAGVIPNPNQPAIAERHRITQDALIIVLEVVAGSSAERAGLLPGDILLALGDQPLEEPGDIAWALAGASAGATLSLALLRGGEKIALPITVGEPVRDDPRRENRRDRTLAGATHLRQFDLAVLRD
jgi:serine protease Do